MLKFTSLVIILFSMNAFASTNGGGLLMNHFSVRSNNELMMGGSGGGGVVLQPSLPANGPFTKGIGGGRVDSRPTNVSNHKIDFIRTLSISEGQVTFLYKPFDKANIVKETVPFLDINELYLNTLVESHQNNEWMAISY